MPRDNATRHCATCRRRGPSSEACWLGWGARAPRSRRTGQLEHVHPAWLELARFDWELRLHRDRALEEIMTSRVTTDHDEIRKWAEERGAKPSAVQSTGDDEGDVGIIRLDFPGYSGEGSLTEISWEQFFEKFEEAGLALIIQDTTADGERSNFNKLIKRDKAA